MTDYSPPLADIRFVLDHVVGLDDLAALPAFEHASAEVVHGAIEEAGRLIAEVIAPLNRTGDVQGSRLADDGTVTTPEGFREAYRRWVDAGWGAVPFDPAYGGGGLPWVVTIAIQEMLTAANMSFSLCPLLTQGAIDLLEAHGSEEQKETYLRKMVSGEWSATMNLTEPQAGSDVGAVRTRAVPHDDGTWRITGQKIFITFGEHDLTDNIVHLVLARVPDAPPGTRGISCFIVPKHLVSAEGTLGERNDVRCVALEHKTGINASPTCVMAYGEGGGGGAVGYLVGEPNAGMRYMFTMMNNARLSVGLEGVSLGERAYQAALEFAVERRQGRAPGAPAGEQSPIVEHPDVRRMLLTMRSTIEAMRCLAYANAAAIDRSRHHPDVTERQSQQELVDLLTPVTKAWCTDLGVETASTAMQVHGGMGYIEETGVAQHWRDARIAPIYEGTNGIQAIDLVMRKLPLRGGAVVAEHLTRMEAADVDLAEAGDTLAGVRQALGSSVATLRRATEWLLEQGPSHPTAALAGATPYLRMFGTVTAGWLMARSALAAVRALDRGQGDTDRLEAKVATARFFVEQLVPQAGGLLAAVTAGAAPLFAVEPKHLAP